MSFAPGNARHANSRGQVLAELSRPFQHARGGPGGWWLLPEPELRLVDPLTSRAPTPVAPLTPDLAGWRRERLPDLPPEGAFRLSPDWICEVLARTTEPIDRHEKMPRYAREVVRHAWLVDPLRRTLEVYTLLPGLRWSEPATYGGDARVRAAPFDAIELELALLWA